MVTFLQFRETDCSTWFERDRAYVELVNKNTNRAILEWWDDEVREAVEDGFLDPRDYHRSAFEYAKYLGVI